jgi:hypothetical protein
VDTNDDDIEIIGIVDNGENGQDEEVHQIQIDLTEGDQTA